MAATGVELATAWVRLTFSAEGSQQQITDETAKASGAAGEESGKRFSSGFGKNLATLGAALGGVFAVKQIAEWGKAQVESLARIETINTQTATVINSTGGAAQVTAKHVEDLAGALENTTATEAESIQMGANMLLTFKNIQNGVGAGNDIFDQATKSLVDMSRAMGSDPQTAAIQLGKALNDPVAGISALSRVGIQFTDDQKALIQSLVDTGQTAEAQKIILGELNSQFGGSGQAYAETYAGKIALLGHAWGTFGEQIFSVATPALGAVAGGLTNLLNNVLTPFVANVQGGFQIVSAAFRGVQTDGDILEPSIAGPLMMVGQTLRQVYDGVIAPVMAAVGPLFQQLVAAVSPLLPLLVQAWTSFSPFSLLLQAVAPVLPQLASAFGELASVVGAGLLQAASTLVPILSQLAQVVVGILGQAISAALPIILQLVQIAGPLLESALSAVLPLLTAAGQIFGQLLTAVMPLLTPILSLISPLLELASKILAPLVALFSALIHPILTLLSPILALVEPLVQLAVVLLQPIIDLLVMLAQIATDLLVPAIAALTPILTGVADALGAVLGPAVSMITDILNGLITFLTGVFTGNWEQAWDGLVQIFSGIWDGIAGMAKGALNGLIDIINGLIGGVNAVTSAVGIPAIPEIPGLWQGGTVTRGGAVLVGERGPEVLRLPRGAEVDPDLSTAGRGGVNLNVYAADGMDEGVLISTALAQLSFESDVAGVIG